MISEYFSLIFPYLLINWVFFSLITCLAQTESRQNYFKFLVPFISVFVAYIPVGGLSISEYLLSINPNFSIGSYGFVVARLFPYIFNKNLLSENDVTVFSVWNLIFSLILYASYFNLFRYDIYGTGYHFSGGFVILAILTLLFIWINCKLSLIFLAYIAAFDLGLLVSPNFFDYITDGFLFLVSVIHLGYMAWIRGWQGFHGASPRRFPLKKQVF